MTPQNLEAIMAELADGDSLDFSDLSIREDEARALVATHLCEIDDQLAAAGLRVEERLELMAAIAAHSIVENMLLNVVRLRAGGSAQEFAELMQRHGVGKAH